MKKFYMPPEWYQHRCCLILYPHNYTNNTFSNIQNAQREVRNVTRAIVHEGNENVRLLVVNEEEATKLKTILQQEQEQEQEQQQNSNSNNNNNSQIHIAICPSDDTWIRDTGPTFCFCYWDYDEEEEEDDDDDENTSSSNNKLLLVGIDWDFNAYGGPNEGCYWPCEQDKQIPSRCCELLQIKHYDCTNTIILEGGSFHTDGEGTLLVTKECLLNSNRNPNLHQDDIESILQQYLGITKIIWLPYGIDGDNDTNGHIDNICCFSKPGNVVLAWTDDEIHDKENYIRCRQAFDIIQSSTDSMGRSIHIDKLQLPPPMYYTKDIVNSLLLGDDPTTATATCIGSSRYVGERIAASYINYYISNDAIIVPQFGIKDTDLNAIQTLTKIFSPTNRKVVGVYSREISIGGGNIHCITQQVPTTDPSQIFNIK